MRKKLVPSGHMPTAAREFINAGRNAALATVLETWGSAPRPVGAQLAIDETGHFEGSVSGGCVEGAVILEAQEVLQTGVPKILEFGVADEDAFAVGLACGGHIRILVEPIGIGKGSLVSDLDRLVDAQIRREPVAYKVNTTTWDRSIVAVTDAPDPNRFVTDVSGFDDDLFTRVFNPNLRMIIVGAVHIAQILAPMARAIGYDVTLVDPRESFGSDARFPDYVVLVRWPDEALTSLKPDTRTSVVTLSHDPKIDTPALVQALTSDAFYIGALGSTRTHAKRVNELLGLGISAKQTARIHAPIGANIGSKSPAEIAVSILAQVTERLRKPETRP